MESVRSKPKSFSEVLDQTFRVVKQNFSSLFLVALVLTGPFYVVNYLFTLLSGGRIFRQPTEGGDFWGNIGRNIESAGAAQNLVTENLGLGLLILYFVVTFVMAVVLFPMAQASIVVAADKILLGEHWTVSGVIRRAFSRFWPIVGSTALFAVMIGGGFFGGIVLLTLMVIFGAMEGEIGLILLMVALGIALIGAVIFFATKLSMFFASVTFERTAPGISKSWRLTKGRFWQTLGLIVVLYIIISIISMVVDGISVSLLGDSVVSSLLTNLASMVTMVIFFVGYTIMYFDLKGRNEADDLKGMISSYKSEDDESST